ncbi:MAG: hypothetical protein K2P84_01505 [Undibacterium sp.]|nr:hypothetical protein [Undibacterium sp.]
MKKSSLQLCLSLTLLACSSMASAQFGKLSGLTNPLAGNSSGASAEQIVTKYVNGSRSVMNADAKMLEAVGLKDEAAKASLQAANLTQGATKGNLEEAEKVQTDSSKALEDKLQNNKVTMDAASKKLFAAGVQDLANGVIQYVGMSKDVSGFKPNVASLGVANTAIYVVKSLPSSIKNLASTLKMAMDFSKANDIPVPKEANDATAML